MADLITITVDSSDVVKATQYTNELTAANDRLEKELKPLLAKEKEFQRAIKQVNEAMRLNVITNKQAVAQVQALGKQYGYTQQQIDRATASMTGIRKNTNRMNATIQNAGYQFGDFFVQVQSGQNVLVAFSQQGAQLAGLLPGLAGAVTGVGLVLGSMLARALMESGGLFKSFSDRVDEAKEALDSLQSSSSKLASAIKDDLGGSALEALKIFEDLNLELAVKKTGETFATSLEKSKAALRDMEQDAKNLRFQLRAGADNAEEIAELSRKIEGLQGLSNVFDEIENIDLTNANELESAMLTVAQQAKLLLDTNKINKEQFDKLEGVVSALYDRLKSVTESSEGQEESVKKTVEYSRELVQLFGQLQSLSAGIDEAFKRTAIQASLIGQGVGKALAGQMASMRMKVSEERAKLIELVGPRFADELLKGRSGQLAQYEAMLAQINAPTPSTGGGGGVKPEDQGEKLAQAYAKFQDKLNGVLLSRRQEILLNRKIVDLSKEEQDLVKALGVTREQLNEDQKRSYDEILELRRQDIALMKKQQAEEERLAKAKEKVQAVASTLANETVGALRSIVNGTKTASEAFRDMALNIIQQIMDILIWQPLIQSLTNSISGFIMGGMPVPGQRGGGTGFNIGSMIGGLFGGGVPSLPHYAKGGAFSAGNVIPFANGGIVGSPTMFGMSGGRTGLMGEAGPEAIMPLKRGPNGKLGVEGGGNVTVNQTFNFAANGDDSVKKIIAEAAPKIAKMTEAQIINSRQRGGQMRRAFG